MRAHLYSPEPAAENRVVPFQKNPKRKYCISCGTDNLKPGRRYCSPECRQHTKWVLNLSEGLLRTFNARYAAFSFTTDYVILDILSVWSREISRFIHLRMPGNKPSQDLKNLILDSGRQWYAMLERRVSRSRAALHLLERSFQKNLDPESIKPESKTTPRLSRDETKYLKVLDLGRQDLASDDKHAVIRKAYKRMAKYHHPDVGGDTEKFKELSRAHEKMLMWCENPSYTCKKALQDCWSYDSATNRWSPPL
jgi:hypothetical protein